MNKKKQSVLITKLKAENYDLKVRNEFLENKDIILKAEKEEKKDVELVRGRCYHYKAEFYEEAIEFVFRYKEKNESHVVAFSLVSPESNNYIKEDCCAVAIENIDGILEVDDNSRLIAFEEENGKFWNDEKQDFLKLEDVYFVTTTYTDKVDLNYCCCNNMIESAITLDKNCSVISFNGNYVGKHCFIPNKISVTKEVFIKLLKNYKG